MKFLLHKDQGMGPLREVGNRLRARGTGHHWIEKYRGEIFVIVSDARDEDILREEFADVLDAVGEEPSFAAASLESRAAQEPHMKVQQQEIPMSDAMYPTATRELAMKRRELAPETEAAFKAFSQKVFEDGALPAKYKQLIAVAVAHATQCPYCIKGHTKAAIRHGASREELMEAIWVASEMRAGAAYAHSLLAIEEMENAEAPVRTGPEQQPREKDRA